MRPNANVKMTISSCQRPQGPLELQDTTHSLVSTIILPEFSSLSTIHWTPRFSQWRLVAYLKRPSRKALTISSVVNGEQLQTTSLTEIQTGKATPRSMILPLTFLVKSLAACALMTAVPNSQMSMIFAPGMHWPTTPVKVALTILAASWYLVQTSLWKRARRKTAGEMACFVASTIV